MCEGKKKQIIIIISEETNDEFLARESLNLRFYNHKSCHQLERKKENNNNNNMLIRLK